jgi:hypothetical protein
VDYGEHQLYKGVVIMEYYEVFYQGTTTDGREYILISTGNGTADVETITVGGIFEDKE